MSTCSVTDRVRGVSTMDLLLLEEDDNEEEGEEESVAVEGDFIMAWSVNSKSSSLDMALVVVATASATAATRFF